MFRPSLPRTILLPALLVLALLVAALAPALAADDAASGASTPPRTTTCLDRDLTSPFADTVGDTHRAAIACLVGWEVVGGFTDGTYRPRRDVTRAQAASALHRLLGGLGHGQATGGSLVADVPPGHAHEAGVNALVAAGIVHGMSDTRFAPDATLTRGQLASLLVRTHEQILGGELPTEGPRFSDLAGSPHADSIVRLAAVDVIQGRTDGTFRPSTPVSRAQLAAFFARWVGVLVTDGLADEPPFTEPPARPAPQASTGSSTVSPFGGRAFGVATASNGWNPAEIDEIARTVGQRPGIVLHYLAFTQRLHPDQLRIVADQGAVSLLTWEPFDPAQAHTAEQPGYRLARIVAGDFDQHIRETAHTIAEFGKPVHLRFAHEMNGAWYPWSARANGNRAGDYVRAYRHVHDLFAREGVTNVEWVWSPNVDFAGSQPLPEVYPGDRYVDVIAVDGYNWGTSNPGTSWQSPGQVFDPTLRGLRQLAPDVPIIIGETAAAEQGGDKAAWNRDLFAWLDRQPDVHALVWFHLDKEADWRVDSSPASARAFAAGLGGWLGR